MNKYPSWFIGAVAEQDKSHKDGTSHGVRYRVRRLGIDPPVGDLPDNKLPSFDCLLPLTASGGDNQKGRSVNLDPGDLVFGLHTDAPNHQRGVIIGVLPRTSLINYDNLIKTGDLTTASGADLNKMSQPVQKNEKTVEDLTAKTPREKGAIAAVNLANKTPDPTAQTLAYTATEGEYEALYAKGEVPQGASTGNPDTTSGSRPVVTRTADNFINSTFKTRATRIADNPPPEQLSQIQSQGYTFTPNADGTPGGKLENPNIYTE
jgi:hypothetical protein